jgi:hypothetical protein
VRYGQRSDGAAARLTRALNLSVNPKPSFQSMGRFEEARRLAVPSAAIFFFGFGGTWLGRIPMAALLHDYSRDVGLGAAAGSRTLDHGSLELALGCGCVLAAPLVLARGSVSTFALIDCRTWTAPGNAFQPSTHRTGGGKSPGLPRMPSHVRVGPEQAARGRSHHAR